MDRETDVRLVMPGPEDYTIEVEVVEIIPVSDAVIELLAQELIEAIVNFDWTTFHRSSRRERLRILLQNDPHPRDDHPPHRR